MQTAHHIARLILIEIPEGFGGRVVRCVWNMVSLCPSGSIVCIDSPADGVEAPRPGKGDEPPQMDLLLPSSSGRRSRRAIRSECSDWMEEKVFISLWRRHSSSREIVFWGGSIQSRELIETGPWAQVALRSARRWCSSPHAETFCSSTAL